MQDPFDQLVAYIRQHLSQGFSEESIRKVLHEHGWDADSVHRAFAAIQAASALESVPESVAAQHHRAKKKYTVFSAIGEALSAISKNPIGYLTALAVSAVFTIGSLLILVGAIIALAGGFNAFDPERVALGSLIGMLLLLALAMTVWYTFAGAFLICSTSLAVQAGHNRRKMGAVETIKKSFQALPRVAGANFLFVLVAIWPIVVFITLVLIALVSLGQSSLLGFIPFGLLLFLMWIVFVIFRYALMPYVALFEPRLKLTKTFGRSHQLLKGHKGYWFLVKGTLLIILLYIVIGASTGQTVQEVEGSDDPLVNLVSLVISLLTSAVLTVFYFHRQHLKS